LEKNEDGKSHWKGAETASLLITQTAQASHSYGKIGSGAAAPVTFTILEKKNARSAFGFSFSWSL
jgi:hypothetical protein